MRQPRSIPGKHWFSAPTGGAAELKRCICSQLFLHMRRADVELPRRHPSSQLRLHSLPSTWFPQRIRAMWRVSLHVMNDGCVLPLPKPDSLALSLLLLFISSIAFLRDHVKNNTITLSAWSVHAWMVTILAASVTSSGRHHNCGFSNPCPSIDL